MGLTSQQENRIFKDRKQTVVVCDCTGGSEWVVESNVLHMVNPYQKRIWQRSFRGSCVWKKRRASVGVPKPGEKADVSLPRVLDHKSQIVSTCWQI